MSYLSTVLANTPLHYWRFADGGGALCHDIGSAPVHGVSPDLVLGYTGPAANGGSARSSGQGAMVIRETIAGTNTFSIELWLWLTEQTPSANRMTVGWDGVTGGLGAALLLDTARKNRAFVGAGGAVQGATAMTLRTWHHVVLTYDGATGRIYLDGALDGSLASVGPGTYNAKLGIGQTPSATQQHVDSWVSEVAIYT